MDGAEVGVLEEANHESFRNLLELESEVVHEVNGDLSDKCLEGELSDESKGSGSESISSLGWGLCSSVNLTNDE